MRKYKNPRVNASGYMDLTAFHAIRSADREIRKKKHNTSKGQKARKNQGVQPTPINPIKENGGLSNEN